MPTPKKIDVVDGNEYKMIVPQMVSITRSFTKKINLANYVEGRQYESVDVFSSHNETIPLDEATPEKQNEVSNRLYEMAKADVERSITDYINSLKVEDGEYVAPSAKELADIADLIKGLVDGKESSADDINARKDALSESQLKFLRTLALSIKNS